MVSDVKRRANRRGRWMRRLAVVLLVVVAIVTVFVTNRLLTERFTETVRQRAEVRLTLYQGQLIAELQRASIVPQLLARDPALIGALNAADYTQSTQRLLSFVDEIGAASLMLLDRDGRAVAVTERERLGEMHRQSKFFIEAQRSNQTVFTRYEDASGGYRFVYSRRIEDQGTFLGVIAVEVKLRKLEQSWAGVADAVIVMDSEGRIILTTEPRWRGLEETEALAAQSAPSAIERAIRATADWVALPVDAYLRGEAVMRREARVPFQGWRMVTYTTYASVRDRVNGVLALEIMGFAIILAGGIWLTGRRAANRALFFQRESAELRELNRRLQSEIAERQKVQADLQVAEQTVAQTQKLAALGEMSAAVSHELTQPLAAMKTYLAGARLLVSRRRPEEALAAFTRIDGLIERMGAITKQLKSYARKGSEEAKPVDVRNAVFGALAMMEPQLKSRSVTISRTLPAEPVIILGDSLRLEQVIVNLVRNALDATQHVKSPQIDILLAKGDETAELTVRDNGEGIKDLGSLFEPFYTTKEPGDGVGLGLAISSGIVGDLGGRMTARNSAEGGAVFRVTLPLARESTNIEAAE